MFIFWKRNADISKIKVFKKMLVLKGIFSETTICVCIVLTNFWIKGGYSVTKEFYPFEFKII